jgi:hypothetical protein
MSDTMLIRKDDLAKAVTENVTPLVQRIRDLEAQLRKYGAHDLEICEMFGDDIRPCTCGWDQIQFDLGMKGPPAGPTLEKKP